MAEATWQEVELQKIGTYAIDRQLSTGPASSLYISKQRKKDLIIKIFHTPLPTLEAKEAFLALAKQLKKLKHRYIIDIQDYGLTQHTGEDYAYLVMQYVPAGTVRQTIPPGQRLRGDEVKRILSPLASALHYAHVSNILHGNLHPGNLLVDANNDILLTDFSLPFQSAFPSPGDVPLALPYMAPEQLQGTPVAASDQYSLAVMVYEWFCGRRPYEATGRDELLHQQEHDPLPTPGSLNADISPAIERVLLQALAHNPGERFQHTQAFADNYLHALMGLPLSVETQRVASNLTRTIDDVTISNSNRMKKSVGDTRDKVSTSSISNVDVNKKAEDSVTSTLFCNNCGAANRTGEKYCFHCGQTLQTLSPLSQIGKISGKAIISTYTTLDCSRCGTTNQADANICKNCGSLLQSASPSLQTPAKFLATNGTGLLVPNFLLKQRYLILDKIGQGGYGAVYKVQDTVLGNRTVAVKEMTQDGLSTQEIAEVTEAFKAEAELLAKLKHVSLPNVYDYFNNGQEWYFVMEFIEGETLEDYINNKNERKLPFNEVLYIGIQLCAVLNYLHTHNPPIIFRDLKPLNIMLNTKKQIYLIDFGIARHFKLGKTKDTTPIGTPGYAAPEQYGKGQTDFRSDIYSLGATLHQLLSGSDPSKNPFQFVPLKLNSHPILSKLESLIMQMTDMDRNKRPKSIATVMQELMNIGSQLSSDQNNTIPQDRLSGNQISALPGQLILGSSQNTINNAPIEGLTSHAFKDENGVASRRNTPTKFAMSIGDPDLLKIVTADLCQGGILSRSLSGYEERIAQIEMAKLVARSLTESTHAIVEASTGTGKSLAYLVPIVRSGKVAIVSTANKALQEQLFYKDIPFVQQHIKHFDAALVKGVGNYLCLDRLENERVGIQFYAKNREFTRLVDITNDPDSPFSGDFETLDFQLSGDIRSKVCADSDQCAWSKCGYFSDCYVRKMRAKAERAQVIVVNHTLLLLDAALDGFLLPERDVIVLDEAHHLEEEATRAFTITISPNSIVTLLAQRMLKNYSQLSLQDEANRALLNTWQRLQEVADPGYKSRANLQTPLEEGLKLATVISDLADSLRKQRPKNMPEKEEQLFDKLLKRTQNLAGNIRIVFAVDQPNKFVYYVERVTGSGQRGFQLQVSAAPLDVTDWLKERLFDKCNVICTSATLATIGPNPIAPDEKGPNFAYFRRRTGLDPYERPEVIESILPLSFDYENNALLYLPRDLPAPIYGAGSDDYTKAIAREMYRLVKASRGRAFLLFSSKRMLEQAYDLMAPHLEFPLLRQGDMSRIELTRRFREEKGAVLFGLKSFWEGVDVAGDALSLVVIDKLPFDPPDDPVHEARVAQMKAAGENWFGIYVLPQAVLRLKQGLGRLLRTREDRGVMAILDTRLHTKGYGKQVLDALPPARRTASLKEVDSFFNEEPEPF